MMGKHTHAAAPRRAVLATFGLLALSLFPSGCQRAGDGLGLDAAGQPVPFCKAHPEDPACVAIDPCVANPGLPQCLDSCQATPPAPGCSVDVCKANPADPSCQPVAAKVRFDQVLPILKANQCQQCHTGTGAGVTTGKLLLSDEAAYDNLVNVAVSVQTVAKGWVRVKPLQPDSSMLILKLTKNPPKLASGVSYGAMMPQGATTPLDTSITNVIRKWILDGAEK
jgi:hypothetical protein